MVECRKARRLRQEGIVRWNAIETGGYCGVGVSKCDVFERYLMSRMAAAAVSDGRLQSCMSHQKRQCCCLSVELVEEWRKQHVAFRAESELAYDGIPFYRDGHELMLWADAEQVKQWYEAAIAAGGEDNGKPGPRDCTPDYYGAFVRDPVCGIDFEACCRLTDENCA